MKTFKLHGFYTDDKCGQEVFQYKKYNEIDFIWTTAESMLLCNITYARAMYKGYLYTAGAFSCLGPYQITVEYRI